MHTVKAERRVKEEEDEDKEREDEKRFSPADRRRLEAEKRAAWRQARLRSLENVSVELVFPSNL